MKKIIFNTKPEARKLNKKMQDIIGNETQTKDQNIIINRLYLDDENLENKEVYLSEIKKKLQGYSNQDKKHGIFHAQYFIEMETLLKKMVASKLKCFYCDCNCLFLYDKSYQNIQWTLDRIDNNLGHTDQNTVVCCLQCNLARGNIDHERFKESKKIRIIRKIM
jgi:hypothetical protein